MLQARKWCRNCETKTLHARATFSDAAGCILTVLTLGLFLPVWLVLKVVEALFVPWRCQTCGSGRVL